MSIRERIEKILFTGMTTRKGVKELRAQLVAEIIEPLCRKAFNAGDEYSLSKAGFIKEGDEERVYPDVEEWLTNNLK
jgi:hypothetical protein